MYGMGMVRSGVALILSAWLLLGCGEKAGAPQQQASQFKSTDISNVDFGRDFELTDHNGKKRRLADFKGKVVALFFGYTHCPDVCPTTLSDFAMALKQMGKDAERVQVLFVTVDPERDTQQMLAQYVPSFNPSFLGLYGDAEATARIAKEFKVFYQKQQVPNQAGYSIDHTASTYVYDPKGRLRLLMSYGVAPDVIVHDIRQLLK